jgi:adenine deaminase
MEKISGKIIDVFNERIFNGTITIENDKISAISPAENVPDRFILPGIVDSHLHLESSMVMPGQFAKAAIKNGVVSVVADPHEIANVEGIQGVDFLVAASPQNSLKFYYAAPSCVPAVDFEKGGGVLSASDIMSLLKRENFVALGEMMNFPGVLSDDTDVIKKLEIAKAAKKPVDGHAPGLEGNDLDKYIAAGILTDHESLCIDEAENKILKGMKIQIRKGSAADSFNELCELIEKFPDDVMLCSDDIHPDDLLEKYYSSWIGKAFKKISIYKLIKAFSVNPVCHYKLDVGLLRVGDKADFIVVDNLYDFNVKDVYINGISQIDKDIFESDTLLNTFNRDYIKTSDIQIESNTNNVNLIHARDKELYTSRAFGKVIVENGYAKANPKEDVLKLVLVNRYVNMEKPIVAFIKGFGLKNCAIASSISHDNHNIIAVGTSDDKISEAINNVIRTKGGISFVSKDIKEILELPVAGIISNKSLEEVSAKYKRLNLLVADNGSNLKSPFMTLSFMALPVIPELKISTKGLFDISKFETVPLFF